MGRVRFSGVSSRAIPWWLGLAFVVAFPADAGQDHASGASLAPLVARAPLPPDVLVPPTISMAASGELGRLTGDVQRLIRAASLGLDDRAAAVRLSSEIEPRNVRRSGRSVPQVIAREGRGEPAVGVRPTFDASLRRPGSLARLRLHEALFTHEPSALVGSFTEIVREAAMIEPSCAFVPWQEGETPTTVETRTATSPSGDRIVTMTMRPAAINERLMQGATPLPRRAEALASMTPVLPELIPVEIVAAAAVPPSLLASMARQPAAKPRTSFDLPAGAEVLDKERRCLAEAIYFEARGESEQGQAAVAQVVLNRVASGLYPATICGVVYQNRNRLNACQFSFACDGRSLRVSEPTSWRTAVRIAAAVTNGKTYVADVGNSTHYHANYARPRWASQLEKMDVIGHHIFYKLLPGQN
jgi:hypothetical protein